MYKRPAKFSSVHKIPLETIVRFDTTSGSLCLFTRNDRV